MKFTGFYFSCLLVLFLSCESKKLPVLGSPDHHIRHFAFINQDGKNITEKNFEHKIYVADFFFTTCPTICPIMKKQMLRIQKQFRDNENILFLSHTIDPDHDSVSVLKDYAERIGADTKQWMFVTGSKDEIYKIANEDYNAVVKKDGKTSGGFAHSGALILVDKDKKVRGIYDGTKEDQVNQLIKDIPILLKEYN